MATYADDHCKQRKHLGTKDKLSKASVFCQVQPLQHVWVTEKPLQQVVIHCYVWTGWSPSAQQRQRQIPVII